MGNTTSEVASGVKAQINSGGQGPELYKYVDFKVDPSRRFCSHRILFGFPRRVVANLLMLCAWQIERKITHRLMR